MILSRWYFRDCWVQGPEPLRTTAEAGTVPIRLPSLLGEPRGNPLKETFILAPSVGVFSP